MTRTLRRLPVLALVALTGCMSSQAPRASYSSAPSASGRTMGASLVLVNNASQPIFYFYASACSSSSWGPDRLGNAEVVMPGSRKAFTMTTGCWDLKAVYRDGTDVVRRNAQISASDWTWTVG